MRRIVITDVVITGDGGKLVATAVFRLVMPPGRVRPQANAQSILPTATNYPQWAGQTAIAQGVVYVPLTTNGLAYKATVSGTTAAAEPTWPTTLGQTVVDGGAGGVTWTCVGADLNGGCTPAELLELQAGLVVEVLVTSSPQTTFAACQTELAQKLVSQQQALTQTASGSRGFGVSYDGAAWAVPT